MRLLLVRLGSLGDIVHALPVAAAVRRHAPDARIDWLVDARYSDILDLVPAIDSRVVIAPASRLRIDRPGHPTDRRFAGWSGVVAAVRYLRRQQYDAAVDLQGLIKSAALARASGARRVIGFARDHLRERQASIFYTETRTPDPARPGRHVIDKNLSLLPALGVGIPERLEFPIDVPVSPALETVREALQPLDGGGFVLVNPGAAWPNKRWPPERFGEVARRMRETLGLPSVVSWGPGEEELARQVASGAGGCAIVAPPTGIGDLLAIAGAARLVLSGDTGPLHLAGAMGTPIVALFGPTDPARNGPWPAEDVSLSRFGECVCHYERRCRRGGRCIDDITVEDVLGAIERRLAFVPRPRA